MVTNAVGLPPETESPSFNHMVKPISGTGSTVDSCYYPSPMNMYPNFAPSPRHEVVTGLSGRTVSGEFTRFSDIPTRVQPFSTCLPDSNHQSSH